MGLLGVYVILKRQDLECLLWQNDILLEYLLDLSKYDSSNECYLSSPLVTTHEKCTTSSIWTLVPRVYKTRVLPLLRGSSQWGGATVTGVSEISSYISIHQSCLAAFLTFVTNSSNKITFFHNIAKNLMWQTKNKWIWYWKHNNITFPSLINSHPWFSSVLSSCWGATIHVT